MSDTPQDGTAWIAERAKCNLYDLFTVLRTLAKAQVDAANGEGEQRRWEREFVFACEPPSQPAFRLTRRTATRTRDWLFQYGNQSIQVTGEKRGQEYGIWTRWDAEACQCWVVVGRLEGPDEPQEPLAEFRHADHWKAMQYLLEPFFFPE